MNVPVPTDQPENSNLLTLLTDTPALVDESDDSEEVTCMQAVLDALGMTGSAFARKHGFNAGSIYNMANGTCSTSYDLLWSICEVEPRISAEYLLRGEGKPLRDLDAMQAVAIEQLEALKVEVVQTIDRHIEGFSC